MKRLFPLFCLLPCLAPLAPAKVPNVILVITDDQGYGDLSAHGNPVLKTPHLDRLHSQSVRFSDFHVAPMCTPTRCARTERHSRGRLTSAQISLAM